MNQKPPSLVAMLLASFALGTLLASLVALVLGHFFAGVSLPPPSDLFAGVTAAAATSIAWKLSKP